MSIWAFRLNNLSKAVIHKNYAKPNKVRFKRVARSTVLHVKRIAVPPTTATAVRRH